MRILTPTAANLKMAAELLAHGGVVGMPTETVYGLAASAFREDALARVFAVKERPVFDPLIVHIALDPAIPILAQLQTRGLIDASNLTGTATAVAERLMDELWPGPLTLVLPRSSRVPDLVTSGLPTVALRMPRHPVAQALLELAGPLAAPSANRFGRISPTRPEHVEAELGDRVELTLDGGPCAVGVESTVLAVAEDGVLTLLRPGGTALGDLERVANRKIQADRGHAVVSSPGQMDSHYAPRVPLYIMKGPAGELSEADRDWFMSRTRSSGGSRSLAALSQGRPASENTGRAGSPPDHLGLLVFAGDATAAAQRLASLTGARVTTRLLSSAGDLAEAARHLFAHLRELDTCGASAIFAEPCPISTGLGHAITDRLKRASKSCR